MFAPPPIPQEEPVVAPPPIEEPAAAPEPDPIPAPAAAPAAESGKVPDWDRICQAAEPLMNPGQYHMLHNPNFVWGCVENGVLTLEMDRALAYMMLNTPETAQKLRQAARACGCELDVRIVPSETQAQTELRSLEELARFENVEFK